jgi:hypothetical protein
MNQLKQPTRCNLVIELFISKFIEGSTCFEPHTSHQQELETLFAAFGLYTHVVTARCPGLVGNLPLSLDNDWSPHEYINQRLQIQFGSPNNERYVARNMLSIQ